MKLSYLSVKRPVSVCMFFLGLVLLGFIALNRLPVDLFPTLKFPKLVIRTYYTESPPNIVMHLVTRPLEECIAAVKGVKQIVSYSREGVSWIEVEFYWGTNIDMASLAIREKLDEIRYLLPAESERPHILRLDPTMKPILQVAVSGIELDRLKRICSDLVRRRIEQIKGAAMVEVVGGIDYQIVIEIDPNRILAQGIQIQQIVQALQMNNLSRGGGVIKNGPYRFSMYIDGEFRTLDDIKNTAFYSSSSQKRIFLKDIARIDFDKEDRKSITRFNQQESIGLLITREWGSNTVSVTQDIEKCLNDLSREIKSIHFDIITRQADVIQDSLNNLLVNLIMGAILAFLGMVVFLRNFRHPLIISVSIPVSILSTFLILYMTNVSLNIMSLGGLALGIGMMVDNSIVVLENIYRLRETGCSMVRSSSQGATEVTMPIIASTLTTCAVFLPIIFVYGISGQIFRDYSLSLVFSLLISILTGITLIPVLTSQLKGRSAQFMQDYDSSSSTSEKTTDPHTDSVTTDGVFTKLSYYSQTFLFQPGFNAFNRFYTWLYDYYHRSVLYALDHKPLFLWVLAGISLLVILMAMTMKQQLMPPLNQEEVRYQLELPVDASLEQTETVVRSIEERWSTLGFVQSLFSRIGTVQSLMVADKIQSENQALITVRLKPDYSCSSESPIESLRKALPTQYIYHGYFESGDLIYNDILGFIHNEIQIDIQGITTEFILPIADQLKNHLAVMPELKDVRLSYIPGVSQYQIQLDRDRAALSTITTNDLVENIQSRSDGIIATQIREYERSIDVVVRAPANQRDSWEDIDNHLIRNLNGIIPLKSVIHSQLTSEPEFLLRQDQAETIRIFASIVSPDRAAVIDGIMMVIKKFPHPESVSITLGGEYQEMMNSFRSLWVTFLLSVILIFLILAAQFESLKYPFLVLMSIPYGMIGAIPALWITGQSFNVMAGIGFVVLTGIVINDDIIKIDCINQNRKHGMGVRDAILDAGKKRFRPILITTLTTILGLIPMAWFGNNSALQKPIAFVIIFGLISGTVLTFIMVPVFYELLGRYGNDTTHRKGDSEQRISVSS